uniref:Thioredoxin domain-containing protein n=1 Tax=Tetradesmus obliquus TaxID=3088 RepID=A0A383W1D9_TETOB|eukprot:jgi/Sobl393_1/524/SZX71311.1
MPAGQLSVRVSSPVARGAESRLGLSAGKHKAQARVDQWSAAHRVGIAAAAAPHESATTTAEVQTGLLELNKETFDDYISAAGDVLVVVDFFTEWCGPCKLIYPQLVALSEALAPAAVIVKFNCNQANKELAKTLGIKVAPTFQLYRGGAKVGEMTGAKVERLKALIDEQLNQN